VVEEKEGEGEEEEEAGRRGGGRRRTTKPPTNCKRVDTQWYSGEESAASFSQQGQCDEFTTGLASPDKFTAITGATSTDEPGLMLEGTTTFRVGAQRKARPCTPNERSYSCSYLVPS